MFYSSSDVQTLSVVSPVEAEFIITSNMSSILGLTNVRYVMFQQNANKQFFVCVTNSQNIIPLPQKVISHDPLQKNYPTLARTCKNKFYGDKIMLNWLNLLKKFLLWYNWQPLLFPSLVSDRVKGPYSSPKHFLKP